MTKNKNYSCNVSDIFICARCGYCCHGETTVSLDEDDQQRMADKLGMTNEEVKKNFWRVTGSIVQMKTIDGHCIFYSEESGCTVHEGRPWRCGQWPLHPSILSDENNLATIRESCPGINKTISYQEFCEILGRLIKDRNKMVF
ncbi:MAG: YkgJ family cysteine cluster protein [Desulfobulbaceae bacterium]|nr:YkgJ family cysteine cluster protein [Desulfobulbaceae bacterium]